MMDAEWPREYLELKSDLNNIVLLLLGFEVIFFGF